MQYNSLQYMHKNRTVPSLLKCPSVHKDPVGCWSSLHSIVNNKKTPGGA